MTVVTRKRIGVGEVRISRQARLNVLDVLNRHRLSYGVYSEEFERRMALLHAKRYACFVNSGTDALRIGLLAMKEHFGWLPNANVILPALTFISSHNVIRQAGLTPRFVDIELETYGIDPDKLDQAYGDVAIMPVHLFGQPVRPEVITWARERNYRVIDDSCEAVMVPGIATGDVSCFSLYACHLVTSGVGGVAATSDPQLATLLRSYANHGRDGIYSGIDEALGNKQVIDGRFRFQREGYSSRLTEMEAGLALPELEAIEDNVRRRRANADVLTRGLSGLPLVLPKAVRASSWMMYVVRCEDHETRDRLVQHLESNGIETRYAVPLTNQPFIKKLYGADVEDRYPNAKLVNETAFYVGCHQYLNHDDIEHMVSTFRSFYGA